MHLMRLVPCTSRKSPAPGRTLYSDAACLCRRGRARAVAVGAGVRVGAFVHLVIVEERPACCGRVVDARRRVEVLGANILVGLRLDKLPAGEAGGGSEFRVWGGVDVS